MVTADLLLTVVGTGQQAADFLLQVQYQQEVLEVISEQDSCKVRLEVQPLHRVQAGSVAVDLAAKIAELGAGLVADTLVAQVRPTAQVDRVPAHILTALIKLILVIQQALE
jgi:hypothetical protein